MSGRFVCNIKSMQPDTAGIGAIINYGLLIAEFNYTKYGDFDVAIDVPELEALFQFPANSGSNLDLETEFWNSGYTNRSDAHSLPDIDHLRFRHKIWNELFKLRDEEKYLDLVSQLITDKTLGIHLRGTDKSGEVTPPTDHSIIQMIKHYLSFIDIDRIYLATDDLYYRKLVVDTFGSTVVFRDDIRLSKFGRPLHFKHNRKQLNFEALSDAYLLANSPSLIFSRSNLSYLALTIGINDFRYFSGLGPYEESQGSSTNFVI